MEYSLHPFEDFLARVYYPLSGMIIQVMYGCCLQLQSLKAPHVMFVQNVFFVQISILNEYPMLRHAYTIPIVAQDCSSPSFQMGYRHLQTSTVWWNEHINPLAAKKNIEARMPVWRRFFRGDAIW